MAKPELPMGTGVERNTEVIKPEILRETAAFFLTVWLEAIDS